MDHSTKLARTFFVAFIADRLRISMRSAEKYVDQHDIGYMWYHAAEYVEKLYAGYLPLDLHEMRLPPPAIELPLQ